MSAAELKARVLPSLLAGTSRHPLRLSGEILQEVLQDDAKAGLRALSLTGHALRFERPVGPPSFSEEPEIRDDRRIVPDSLRRPLIRLLAGRVATDHPASAVAWTMDRLRLRPHPFDLPRLDGFVRAHAEELGVTAQHWSRRQDDPGAPGTTQREFFAPDELDETTWASATSGRKARFIEERRRHDAAAARELLEPVWAQQDADTRVRLLMALRTGLSAGDRSFLEALERDRAPRVRALAQRLLSRLPGAVGENPALRACLERIRRSGTGLFKKRPVLAIELPATVKDTAARDWIRETFAEVSCDELARGLGMAEAEMIDAAAKDANLLLGVAWMATQDGRIDLLEQVVRHLPDVWEQMCLSGIPDWALMPSEQRMQWAETLTRPYGSKPPGLFAAWSWLHRALKGSLPKELMEAVVGSPAWLTGLQDGTKFGAEWPEVLAACCPGPQRDRLRDRLAAVDPALTMAALPLLDILDALEAPGNTEKT